MQFVVNVAVLASTYALLAVGYVLVYRASRVLNLAHGALMLLAAYLLFAFAGAFPSAPALVIPLTVVAASALGAGLYLLVVRRMAGRPMFSTVLLTVAVGIAIEGLVVLIWSPRVQYPASVLGISDRPLALPFGGAISTLSIVTVASALVVIGLLVAFFRYARLGTHMLAAAENPLLVAQRGIDVHRLFAIAWALAIGSAAIAGILYALSNRLEGSMAIIGLKAFPTALVGGLGSLNGVLPAAVLIALAEVAAIQLVSPQLSDVVPFLVLLVALLVRPWGLAGTPEHVERA